MIHSWMIFAAAVLVSTAIAERISQSPDITWNRGSSNSNSDSDRFPITGGSGSSRGSSFNSGSSRFSDTGSDTGSSFSGSSSRKGDPNYVQIIASLVRLSNSKGQISTGSTCASFGGKCDPLVFANLDTERPNAAWPGATDVKFWPLLLSAKKSNDLDIQISNITKRYCGNPYKEANLRVHIEDKKTLSSNGLINEFDCPITRDPARDQMSATWSPEMTCIARFPKGGQTLTYKYKVFYVDKFGCASTTPSTTTKGSFFG
jgi:hypothetical protein